MSPSALGDLQTVECLWVVCHKEEERETCGCRIPNTRMAQGGYWYPVCHWKVEKAESHPADKLKDEYCVPQPHRLRVLTPYVTIWNSLKIPKIFRGCRSSQWKWKQCINIGNNVHSWLWAAGASWMSLKGVERQDTTAFCTNLYREPQHNLYCVIS